MTPVLVTETFSYNMYNKSLIDNKAALIPVMACHRKGDKLLPAPMLTHFTDKCLSYKNSIIRDKSVVLGIHGIMHEFILICKMTNLKVEWHE